MAALRLFLALLSTLLLLAAAFLLSSRRDREWSGVLSGGWGGSPSQPGAHKDGLRGWRKPREQLQAQGQDALLLSSGRLGSRETLHSGALDSDSLRSGGLHSETLGESRSVPREGGCRQGCTRHPFLAGLMQRLRSPGALPATARSLLTTTLLRAPFKGCTVTFKNVKRTFARCATLDAAGRFRLAWTLNKKTGVAVTWFQGPPDKAYGWASWGISPSGKMMNSDCLVGYGDPKQRAKVRVRPYFLAGVKPEQCMVDQTLGFLTPVKSTLAVEMVNQGKLIRIWASVKALDITGSKAVIWRGGPGMANFNSGRLLAHKDNKRAVKFIDFTK